MNLPVKGFIFDLNGTMIDDMQYHINAWYHLLNDELGANLDYNQVKSQMYGKNEELLVRVFGKGYFTKQEMDRLSLEKEKRYQKDYQPKLALIKGLPELLEKAHQKNILMAIGSAAIPFNIDFVLDNLHIRQYFKAIVSAENVRKSKPDPETYMKAASLLQLSTADCLVFEDAPKGVESALNAGMKCLVITTMHKREEFSAYSNILSFIQDYTDPQLLQFF
ncbi:MAG TPA: HAD family phosphatase [Puia sp.]|nr:HAD family phosphatase [Puia sp.]